MRRLVLAVVMVLGLGLGVADVAAEPPSTHEVIYTKPSGFWTSNRPAVGGSYRWRLLGLGVVTVALTGCGMLWLVRRAKR